MSRYKRVAIMGTGTMGPGMAAVLARAGMQVRMYDTSAEALERAKAGYDLAWGVLDRLETPIVEGGSPSYASSVADALAGAEFVMEAIPEKLELKQQVYADYERHVGPDVIIASNTSGIPATKIAANLAHPERVVVMHWSNPPHLIPMIEVVPGERTSQAAIDGTIAVVEDVGYYPCLLKKEVPGFVENRVLYAIMRECLALVDEGVIGREELDLNVKWGIGYKLAVIPPMQLLDMAGMDIYTSVAGYLNPELSNATEVSPTIRALVEQGRLGIKTKGGLFDYTDEQVGQLRAQRGAKLVAVRKALS
jgi:3-hydroxybutyryl-CoA dehydrogenase/5-formyl-3-hydroxy-2-methylpyridine 4-carboxylate dehydrogenase